MSKNKKNNNKKNSLKNIIDIIDIKKIVALVIVILIIAFVINIKKDSDVITKVTKVSKDKYDTIRCINNKCDAIVVSEIKRGKNKYKIYNAYGKVVAKYSENSNTKNKYVPYEITKNYLLMQKNKKTYIFNKKGKKIYETSGRLVSINENYALVEKKAKIDYKYTLVDKKGNEIYSKITDYKLYDNNKLLYIKKKDKNIILNSKMKAILNDYEVKENIEKDNTLLYLILKNVDDNKYYYFSPTKAKIVNDGFDNYSINEDKTLTVERKENEKKVTYNIKQNGKQKKISEEKYVSQYIKDIKKKINSSKYSIYTLNIKREDQEKIFVDNKENNSFGLYNLKNGKYEELYSYLTNNIYSIITELSSSDNKLYYQISCSEPICAENKMYVYNFTDSKELFNINGNSLVANYYTQYKNGYKVVKYSYKSNDSKYKGKYVLYDKNNKELFIANNQIIIIDSVPIISGEEINENIVIYSSTLKKVLNDDNSLAIKFTLNDNDYYEYTNSKKTIIVDSKGKKVYSTSSSDQVEYNGSNIFSINSKKITIYNILTKETRKYKMDKNENVLDSSNNKISPFGGVIFINNNEDNYVKIINHNVKAIKKIKNTTIYKVETNKEHKKAFIFTTSKKGRKTKYGFYIAK